ncbi:shikimate kinase [Euzebya tangerina]|uniref:shikimate kinase n=1 Tax=Euzebya tangerina TaxID=591198 RepID=UPI000E30DF63|nr:shikimate kinase [Euzebya tangerina]
MDASQRRHLVITGPMGVGKSTTARAVAEEVGRSQRDSDVDIQRLFGRDGGDIAAHLGVAALHEIEAAVLLGALADPRQLIISAAASTVENPHCRAALRRRSVVVVLDLDLDRQLQRIQEGDHRRSIRRAELDRLRRRREPWLEEVADLRLSATAPPERLRDQILPRWDPLAVTAAVEEDPRS